MTWIVLTGFLVLLLQQAFVEHRRTMRYRADCQYRDERARLLAAENLRTEEKVREVRELLEAHGEEAGHEQSRRSDAIEKLLGFNRAVLDNQREAAVAAALRLDRILARIAEVELLVRRRAEEWK